MTETAVEPTVAASVPALVNTPALEIDADDVALPRLYLGQFSSDHVKNRIVDVGSLFTALGKDDPEPNVLYDTDNEQGVIVHVLGMRKGKSVSEEGELTLYAFDDPAAPQEAWTTYNYVVAIPEADAEVPCKWLITRSATPAAKQMNLVLSKNAARGPAYELAFEVKTVFRENTKGSYYIPQVRHVEAKPENVEIAAKLAALAPSEEPVAFQATGDEPQI